MSETLTMALSPPNTATFPFDALYREAAGDVRAYAWGLLGDRAAAEDVTALAFERAFRLRDAARTALDVLGVLAGVALVGLAVLAPFGRLGGVVVAVPRALRRRRRASALAV